QDCNHIRPVHAELRDALRVCFRRHNAPIGSTDSQSLQPRTNTVDLRAKAPPTKTSLAVRLKPESRPYLAQLTRLLENLYVRARRAKRHRRRQATNAPADNCNPQHGHGLLSTATTTVARGNRTGLPAPPVPGASVVATLPPALPQPRAAASRVTPKGGCCWQV